MKHMIGRLCIRILRNHQKDLVTQRLFTFLLDEKHFRLFTSELISKKGALGERMTSEQFEEEEKKEEAQNFEPDGER